MSVKVCFFDIDGTLVDTTTKTISDSTIKAIHMLKEKGIKVVIATGRHYSMVDNIGIDLDLFDAIICNNGASTHLRNGDIINQHYIDKDDLSNLLEYFNENNITVTIETVDDYFNYNEPNKYIQEAFDSYNQDILDIKPFNNEDTLMLCAYNYKGFNWFDIARRFNLNVFTGATTHCDFTANNITKHSGVVDYLNYLNLDNCEYICFGDQMNDFDMLYNAPIGVVVKDKMYSRHLDLVIDYSCESGVKDGLYNFLVENKVI